MKSAKIRALTAYCIPLCVVLVLWVSMDSSRWGSGHGAPWYARGLLGMWQGCGPVAWLFLEIQGAWYTILFTFLALWSVWFLVVLKTFLLDEPFWMHFLLASFWLAVGMPPPTLVIT